MTIKVKAAEGLSLEEIRAFLEASEGVGFQGRDRGEVYGWVNGTLRQQGYERLKRSGRGLVRRYVSKMTGLSRAQTSRLIGVYLRGEEVKLKPYRRRRFPVRYTREDIGLLARVDEAHDTLSGPATRKLLERAHDEFGDQRYQRLGRISVAQLYRLRESPVYRQKRVRYQKTRPTVVSIGERRKPEPGGRPGYLRVDTVHQGDQDGVKGVYHINVVDEMTQFEIVGAVPAISEGWLLPVLEAMLRQFPFRVRNLHSDNGSEFINHKVDKLLKKLLVEQTKSRPRHSNDNGQVEAKNGAVVRKHMGYTHIAAENAAAIQKFYEEHFNEYLNFHRPCGVPELVVDGKGKEKRVYPWYATPWEILRQIPDLARDLREGVTIADLERQARAKTDQQAAEEMQEAKRKLFASFQSGNGAAFCLPVVGPGQRLQMESGTAQVTKKEERMKAAGAKCLPLVGTGRQTPLGQKGPQSPTKEQPMRSAASDRLPLVGAGEQQKVENTKGTMKGKTIQLAAVERLPLVGLGQQRKAGAKNTKGTMKGKTVQLAAVERLPLVGHGQQRKAGAKNSKGTMKGKTVQFAAVGRLPLVGLGARTSRRKET